VYLAGVAFMVGTIIQGLIALNVQNYTWHAWHGTLLTIAAIVFSIVFNTSLARHLPLIEGTVLILHLAGLFAIIIPLWVMAPRANAHEALFVFTNYGGWSSTGLSAMIGLVTPLSVLIGYDCSVHMSEETNDASITLPRAIMWSFAVNATLGFIMAVTLVFTIGDVDSLFASVTRQPFIQIFFNATRSYTGTNVMVAIVIILLLACCISEVATASRQLWSFARDRGLPFSDWISQVQSGWNVPVNAVLISIVVTSLLSCINLGSYAALNAINAFGGVSILTTYYITIGCIVARRIRGPSLPPRRWSLGKWGLPINIGAILFLTPLWFFCFWPLTTPTTPEFMNWSSLLFASTMLFAIFYYFFRARHVYVGPVMLVKRDE
jgi:choline transport protein